jgi:predicted GNAT family N-acyltransferase
MDRDQVPSRVGRGGPESIPGILIGKLAVDGTLRHQGLGAELLIDALSRCAAAREVGPGFKLVLVDALDDEADSFYRYHGFLPVSQESRTLYRKMADVVGDLA